MFRSLLYLILRRTLGLFRSDERSAGEAELEIAVLRHQLAVLRRQVKRPVYRASDRAFLAAATSARGVGLVPGPTRHAPSLASPAHGEEVDQAAPTARAAGDRR